MLCPTCEAPFVPGRLFCMNCGETSPEGARVMGLPKAAPGSQVIDVPVVAAAALPAPREAPLRVVPKRETASISAVASFVLGCLAWLGLPVVGAIGAVVAGHLARREIRLSQGRLHGTGLATAGLVLGYIQVGLMISVVLAIAVAITAGLALGG